MHPFQVEGKFKIIISLIGEWDIPFMFDIEQQDAKMCTKTSMGCETTLLNI